MGANHEQPSVESIDRDVAAFLTYKRYLQHLQLAVSSTYGNGPAAARKVHEAVKALPSVRRIQRRTLDPRSRHEVTKSLGMAWDRESRILAMPSKSAMLAEDLPGAATDAYYAMFHTTHAWIAASGQPPCPSHAQVLQVLSNTAAQRRLFPQPWDIVCQGYPTDSEVEFLGLPQGFVPLMLHNWQGARLETLHDGLCKLLRTTRAKTLEERKAQWLKQHGGSRVPFAKARALAQAIPPTTIFSFLWRLRHRVDYRDIDDLIPGPDRPHHAVEFHDALATVTSATIALFEGLIERTAGREVIVDSITPFAKKHRKHAARLRRRWPLEGITE